LPATRRRQLRRAGPVTALASCSPITPPPSIAQLAPADDADAPGPAPPIRDKL